MHHYPASLFSVIGAVDMQHHVFLPQLLGSETVTAARPHAQELAAVIPDADRSGFVIG